MALLTIAIPTYNRCRFLQSNLMSIFEQIRGDDDRLEIIVSNNNSSDLTDETIRPYLEYSCFKYYKQDENIDAFKNTLKLVNEYATGEYCWLIDDDNFILNGRIDFILGLLEAKRDVDFFAVKLESIHVSEYKMYLQPFTTSMLSDKYEGAKEMLDYKLVDTFEELIVPPYSACFLTELATSIFKLDVWKQYALDNVDAPYLSTLETSYPHCVVFAKTFVGRKAIYIETPVVLALDGAREWKDEAGYIVIVHFRTLLDIYKENGVSKIILQKAYEQYIRRSTFYAFKFLFRTDNKYKKNVSLRKYFRDIFSFSPWMTICSPFVFLRMQISQCKRILGKIYRFGIPKLIEIWNYRKSMNCMRKNRVFLSGMPKFLYGKLYVENAGTIKIGGNFMANSGQNYNPIGGDTILRLITKTRNAQLSIGDNVGISNSTIVCYDKIEIGDNVMIGGSVKIWDADFHSLDPEIRNSDFDNDIKTAAVKIEKNAFIGSGTIVLKGVTIGENAVIGAGSVVTKSVPSNEVWAGNPAKCVKKF